MATPHSTQYGVGNSRTTAADLGYSISKAASRTRNSLITNPWDTESTAVLSNLLHPTNNTINNSNMGSITPSLPPPQHSSISELEQQQLRDAFNTATAYPMSTASSSVFSPASRLLQSGTHSSFNGSAGSQSPSYLSPPTRTPAELTQDNNDEDPWQSMLPSPDLKIDFRRRISSSAVQSETFFPTSATSSDEQDRSTSWPRLVPSKPTPEAPKFVVPKSSVNWSDVMPRTGPHIPLPIEKYPRDVVDVTVSPEKGGFVFKHINYTIFSQLKSSTVLRRYSEFLWLAEILTKRYPYRILPSLPPKKVVGVHQEFIEKRRQALSRFINFVANHPVFRKDDMVFIFLTWTSSIYSFSTKHSIILEEEGNSLQMDDAMRQSIPIDVHDRLAAFQSNIDFQLQKIHDQCLIMQRIIERAQDTCIDYVRYGDILTSLIENQYVVDPSCEHHIHTGRTYRQVAGIMKSTGEIHQEQAKMTLVGLVEGLRSHSDVLVAFQDLIHRKDRVLSHLMIETISKRIQVNRTKLSDMTNRKAPTKEMERLSHVIDQDQRELELEKANALFIHYCVWSELQLYHLLEDQVTALYQQHANEQILSYRKHYEIWNALSASSG
ncbi:hypothetical protein BASA60_001182 [Batrachochytrium salamandrivorans]|nr:hypothetical protein BASA60_001182 [Batrachochytrium salamandrivorans]